MLFPSVSRLIWTKKDQKVTEKDEIYIEDLQYIG